MMAVLPMVFLYMMPSKEKMEVRLCDSLVCPCHLHGHSYRPHALLYMQEMKAEMRESGEAEDSTVFGMLDSQPKVSL